MKVRRKYKSCSSSYGTKVVFFVGFLIFISYVDLCEGSVGNNNNNNNNNNEMGMEEDNIVPERKAKAKAAAGRVIDAAKALFSLPITVKYYPAGYNYNHWVFRAKDFFRRGSNYFAPPNTDFRDGGGGEEEGAAEKVKEAVVKSFDESKEAMEDSAKSAAKFAEDKLNKLKKTLSGKSDDQTDNDQTEL